MGLMLSKVRPRHSDAHRAVHEVARQQCRHQPPLPTEGSEAEPPSAVYGIAMYTGSFMVRRPLGRCKYMHGLLNT